MKYLSLVLSGLSLIAALVVGFMYLNAPHGVVYINTQEVFKGFEGKEYLESKLDKIKSQHKAQLDSLLIEINMMDGDEKRKRFYIELKNKYEREEREMSNSYTQQVWEQINTYVSDYREESGYKVILGANGQGSIMAGEPALDVTKEVIHFINKKYEGE